MGSIVRLMVSGIDIEGYLINNTPHIGRTFASSEEALEFAGPSSSRKSSDGA